MKLGLYLRNMGPQSTPATLVACARKRPKLPVSTTSGSPTTSRSRPTNPRARAAATSDPLATVAFLAGATERINLGTAVLVLPYRPARSRRPSGSRRSKKVSAGRFLFGVGVGWMEAEFRATGATYRARDGRATRRSTSSPAASRTTRSRATGSRSLPAASGAPSDPGWRPAADCRFAARCDFGDGWMPMLPKGVDPSLLREPIAAPPRSGCAPPASPIPRSRLADRARPRRSRRARGLVVRVRRRRCDARRALVAIRRCRRVHASSGDPGDGAYA